MTVMLTRKDGTITPFINAEFMPAFYFIPEEFLVKCGNELYTIPRNIYRFLRNRDAHKVVESDLFKLAIIDCYAYMAWPYMPCGDEYMEIYSGDDPLWRIAHCAPLWINELQEQEVLPTAEKLFRDRLSQWTIPFLPIEVISDIMSFIVPKALERNNLTEIVETVMENRCAEDYDGRESNRKIDFHRKWYHTRTKHPQISLEQAQEESEERTDGAEFEVEDPPAEFEKDLVSELDIDQFVASLSDKDREILQLRKAGESYVEIAKKVGFQTHSAVGKRLKKIGKEYQLFSGMDLGFE